MANAWGGSKYFQINPVRRQQDTGSDVQRGLQIGQEIGKLIGGVAGAVKSAQADAAANQLMTSQNIANQPGAGVTQDLGKLPAGGSDGSGTTSSAPIDLGTAPIDQFTNPSTGNIQPTQQAPGEDDTQLQQAMAAARLGSGPTVGSMGGPQPGGPQPASQTAGSAPDLNQAIATSKLSQPGGSDFTLNPSDYSSGGTGAGTVGGLIFTGGVAGMKQQQEFQKSQAANQLQKLQLAAAQRQASTAVSEAPINAAMKRAQLAAAQAKALSAGTPKTAAAPKEGPPTNINEEPVTSDTQLSKFVDGQYGNGTMASLTSMLADGSTDLAQETDANGKPVIDPTTGQPKMKSTISVPLGKNKSANIPLPDLQTYTKQKNALRLKQNLPLFRVPGEDQSVGATQNNPYPAMNKKDAMSRARGTWVKLPQSLGGQIVQVGA